LLVEAAPKISSKIAAADAFVETCVTRDYSANFRQLSPSEPAVSLQAGFLA